MESCSHQCCCCRIMGQLGDHVTIYHTFKFQTELLLLLHLMMWRILPCPVREPLQRVGQNFLLVKTLPIGIYHYRFIVDGYLTHAPEFPSASDDSGYGYNILNLQVISWFAFYFSGNEDDLISIASSQVLSFTTAIITIINSFILRPCLLIHKNNIYSIIY